MNLYVTGIRHQVLSLLFWEELVRLTVLLTPSVVSVLTSVVIDSVVGNLVV